MSVSEIRQRAAAPSGRINLVYGLILAGLMVEMVVLGVGIFIATVTGDYWGNPKTVRDAAEAGSLILGQAGTIAAVGAWLAPLKFVGFALFFAGIGVALSAIIPRIQLRGQVMATVLPQLRQQPK